MLDQPSMNTPEAYIFETLRTPRGKGKAGGALFEVKPVVLLSALLHRLSGSLQGNTGIVEDAIIGCVTPVHGQGFNVAKAALLHAGWSNRVSGMQINRYCTSGLEAVNLAAMKVRSGWAQMVVAGGVESMSRIPIGSDGGALISDPELIGDQLYPPQGISADLIAGLEGFSRTELDEWALLSQHRAALAWNNGYFQKTVVPIYDQNGLMILDRDEAIRPDTTLEGLSALPPAFAHAGRLGFDALVLHRYPQLETVHHVHTAGNSSGIVDGAAAALIGTLDAGRELDLHPRARIVSVGYAGTDPTAMLTGPAPAARQALERAGMQASDVDLWECNEAFAAVVLKFIRELSIDPEHVNVNGGAIAMGHPLGATGAMLVSTVLDELERRDLSTGLVTLCAGGGMGVATIIERV